MTYHTCTSCPPHTTLDHGDNGKGACLMPDCSCRAMVKGAEFIKPLREKLSRDEAIQAVEDRKEAEP